jgi:SAM-dependent methyltransferase
MAQRVCPVWLGWLLISPMRRWMQNPEKILSPFLRAGMTALEPGPGMGFFTLPMARAAGPRGRVVALDIQQPMLDKLRRRAFRAGLSERIETRLVPEDSLGISDLRGKVDFVLAFYLVHEMPSAEKFFAEIAAALKPGGQCLLSEPKGHVDEETFAQELAAAAKAGLQLVSRPRIHRSYSAVLRKP